MLLDRRNRKTYETVRDHSLSTYAKFSEKLKFLTPCEHQGGAYQGVRNSFSENVAYVLN